MADYACIKHRLRREYDEADLLYERVLSLEPGTKKEKEKEKEKKKKRKLKRTKADQSFRSAGVKSTITKAQLQAVKQAKKSCAPVVAALSY